MRKSRLSQYKQNKLIELFVASVTARTAVQLVNVNKTTAAYFTVYAYSSINIATAHRLEMPDGEIEADESYFGGIHKKANVSWCWWQNRCLWSSKE